jgi:hypothetical protein
MSHQEHFATNPKSEIQRSKFDRSHGHTTTIDAGYLYPVFVDEVLPGDTFNVNHTMFARMATPLKPIMDNIYLDTQYFFVPNRLVWDNWQEFMGERKNPDDDPSIYTVPITAININSINVNRLWKYMGIPHRSIGSTTNINVNALPFRAAALVWNEWYRDQNLQDRIPIDTGDGPDTWVNQECFRRGKRHDYFTSCLPWPQKGDPVTIPIGDQATVKTANVDLETGLGNALSWRKSDGTDDAADGKIELLSGSTYENNLAGGTRGDSIYPSNLYADLSEATAITINELRTAFQIQKLLERDARGGTRYIELILEHFGVRSPDGRMQRPEYLGGNSTRVNINPVAATATAESVPQGNLAAVGTAVNRAGFTKSFTEHGYIIGFASVRADLRYQQGLERMWSRQTRYDFYWPTLAHLGEQAVLNKEIFVQGTGADDAVFGYQERYAEYRYKPSRITGLFASENATSLDQWHLAQDFATLPTLSEDFIIENPPMDRVVAVPSEPDFLLDCWFDLKCDRPMPVYSIPGFIDHF